MPNQNQLSRTIRYYIGPWWKSPIIPKVTVTNDGFLLQEKKLQLTDIVSVYYRNIYSPENDFLMFVGVSYYEILTKNETLFFYGKHDDLANFFDANLEQETNFEDKLYGTVRRWKQRGSQYQFVSVADELSRKVSEKFSSKLIPIRWLGITLLVFVLILILASSIFVLELLRPLWSF